MRQIFIRGKGRRWAAAATLLLTFAVGVGVAFAHRATVTGTVNLRATSLGKVLVSANGHALYLFKHDSGSISSCYGTCATDWPPLLTKAAKPSGGSGVRASLLGTTRRKDGKLQITYHGHPLYWFFLDKKAGQTNGEGQNFFGGKWYLVDATGAAVVKTSAGTTTAGTTTSGGGYGYGP